MKKQACEISSTWIVPRQRSMRINGFATCVRLEEVYWRIIETLAERESVTVGKLVSKWALEMDLSAHEVKNFTGYLRVVCVVEMIKRIQPSSSGEPDDFLRILGAGAAS
ncbi:ribbon-helix-helix domain-containing protein [Caballeronia sp. LZ065]|uniref:ribbon-helix-helix domain-containing protein n=1 Tax=Caballeronia sp. LZ065 TaxID=3038571 RepID=UPI002861BD39|nr:ribbon-helix-helix domain-containing protein [Caballeronia sp. LZ065]MDR5782066.1 ribbon-helix-helix domain-containing protein [Caballeronia sp. LZ065]